MLPNESIRFFHVDRNWLDALVDGALSVGMLDSRGTLPSVSEEDDQVQKYHELLDDLDESEVSYQEVRKQKLVQHLGENGVPVEELDAGIPMTGFLIRSTVVHYLPSDHLNHLFTNEELDLNSSVSKRYGKFDFRDNFHAFPVFLLISE